MRKQLRRRKKNDPGANVDPLTIDGAEDPGIRLLFDLSEGG
jgi:hypothetical protein